jgi:hypothetical protein
MPWSICPPPATEARCHRTTPTAMDHLFGSGLGLPSRPDQLFGHQSSASYLQWSTSLGGRQSMREASGFRFAWPTTKSSFFGGGSKVPFVHGRGERSRVPLL